MDFTRTTEQASNYNHLEKMTVKELLTNINKEDKSIVNLIAESSNNISFIGFIIYGLNPIANSPIYLAPSSLSNISFNFSVSLPVASIILPFSNTSRMSLNTVPWYNVSALNCITPFTESFTGAVKHSPSGMFRSPAQAMAGISLIENFKSVFWRYYYH